MARIARAVAPGIPHHITQRGNRRLQTFFNNDDYQFYLEVMSEWCKKLHVDIWAYCLMPNHVHLIAVPETKDGLKKAIGEAHRRYTRHINSREGWCGDLWQGRFSSFIMDQRYLLTCTRYVELNPIRSGLATKPEEWPWSSARAHITGDNDILVNSKSLLKMVNKPWKDFLLLNDLNHNKTLFRKHERTGRPLGENSFIEKIESLLDRKLKPQKPGPKKKTSKTSPLIAID